MFVHILKDRPLENNGEGRVNLYLRGSIISYSAGNLSIFGSSFYLGLSSFKRSSKELNEVKK